MRFLHQEFHWMMLADEVKLTGSEEHFSIEDWANAASGD
jgi:hypothetical protein